MTKTEIIGQCEANLETRALKFLTNSERSGNTVSKEDFVSLLQGTIKMDLLTFPDIKEEDRPGIIDTLQSYCSVSLGKHYDDSLKNHPREINGKRSVDEVSDADLASYESDKSSISGKLINVINQYLADSEKYNTIPTETDIQSHVLGRMENLIAELPDEKSQNYCRAYLTPEMKNACSEFLQNSLRDYPRTISATATTKTTPDGVTVIQATETKVKLKKKDFASEYAGTNVSFSGHDMVCIVEMPLLYGGSYISVIGSLQTVTYSIHDEKTPVRCLGDMNPKGYIFGPRTIAGSLIFTVFNHHWMQDMMTAYKRSAKKTTANALSDEFPAFNLTISMVNEYGKAARLAIYGVTLVNEGQVMSINDIYTENTYQFFAMDIDYLTDETDKVVSKSKNSEIDNLPTDGEANLTIPIGGLVPIDDGEEDSSETETVEVENDDEETVEGLEAKRTAALNQNHQDYEDGKISLSEMMTRAGGITLSYDRKIATLKNKGKTPEPEKKISTDDFFDMIQNIASRKKSEVTTSEIKKRIQKQKEGLDAAYQGGMISKSVYDSMIAKCDSPSYIGDMGAKMISEIILEEMGKIGIDKSNEPYIGNYVVNYETATAEGIKSEKWQEKFLNDTTTKIQLKNMNVEVN